MNFLSWFVLLQIFSMNTYQSLEDIASNRGDGVVDPSLSSGKIYVHDCLLFIYDLFGAIGAS